jgi:hypothetical protein
MTRAAIVNNRVFRLLVVSSRSIVYSIWFWLGIQLTLPSWSTHAIVDQMMGQETGPRYGSKSEYTPSVVPKYKHSSPLSGCPTIYIIGNTSLGQTNLSVKVWRGLCLFSSKFVCPLS